MASNDWFTEVADGLHRSMPPQMIPSTQLNTWLLDHQKSTNGLFASVYKYPTPDPQSGRLISPLYFDFDAESPIKAQHETINTINLLMQTYEIPENAIAIYFTGMKGFCITVDSEVLGIEACENLPQIFKSIAKEFELKLKLKYLNLSVYDRRRLLRIPNSRHNKSSLFKIVLTKSELENMNIDDIKTSSYKTKRAFHETRSMFMS